MKTERIYLKDHYPELGTDAYVDQYLPLNMWEMGRENAKRPCAIVCPGGAYCYVAQRENEPYVFALLTAGYNVFALTYSVQCPFPTQLREVAACMELIYDHAEEWHCDTDRVMIIGSSAGGHLSAHYSTRFNCPEVREVFPESKPVNATVLCYPVITADPQYTHQVSINTLLGHEAAAGESTEHLSCERLVTDHTPPAFIWHTAADDGVPVQNSLLYAQALAAHNIPVELHVFPFGPHGMATSNKETMQEVTASVRHVGNWVPLMLEWLDLIFG